MLVELTVRNFKAIKEEQVFSMVASARRELRREQVFSPGPRALDLLHAAVLYGPNASGKSTWVQAIAFMRRMVVVSAFNRQVGDEISGLEPFALDEATGREPCEFEAIFIADGVRYQYGFSADHKKVHGEWLIAFPEGRAQRWFERSPDGKWFFGGKFQGQKQVIRDATRDNALFLSTAVMLNNQQLRPVYNWFKSRLHVLRSNDILPMYTATRCLDRQRRDKVLSLLQAADLSIDDLEVKKDPFADEMLSPGLDPERRDRILKEWESKGRELVSVRFVHKSDKGQISLKMDQQSDGTRVLFGLSEPIADVLEHGRVLIIDELSNHFHSLLTRLLVHKFSNACNPHHAQLIFTTHDSSLLSADMLRRDQIWFFERNRQTGLSSILFPLSDFKPRKEEALEKGYLEGRYGGVPYLSGSLHG